MDSEERDCFVTWLIAVVIVVGILAGTVWMAANLVSKV
jgi:hypothetical protein